MNYKNFLLVAAILFLFCSCGAAKGTGVTISPANQAVNQALDVAITATFTGEISEPGNWSNVFSLKENNIGDNLYTSITYNTSSHVATCAHDPLTAATSYTVTVSGVLATNGEQITFTTVAAASQEIEDETVVIPE